MHAYPDGTDRGAVELEMFLEPGGLHVRVSDHGSGMRPDDRSSGAGYGLSIVGQLASAVTVSSGAGTQVDMCFD